MIIKSFNIKPEDIGTVIRNAGINDQYGNHQFVPFMVIKEVTKEDFLKEATEEGHNGGIILPQDKFYLISVD